MAARADVCLPAADGWGEFGAGDSYPWPVASAERRACGVAAGWVAGAGWRGALSAMHGDALGAAGGDACGCVAVGAGGVQAGAGGRPCA